MKSLILLTLNAALFSWGAMAFATESAQPTPTSDSVRAELEELWITVAKQAKQIQQLQKELAEQKRRSQELESLCQKHGIDPSKPLESTQPEAGKAETYMYLGKPRTKAWFDRVYRDFADKITFVDGQYLDVGKALVGASEVPGVAEIGSAGETPDRCKVFQVVAEDAILVRRSEFRTGGGPGGFPWIHRELFFHVKGVDTKDLTDGAEFSAKLLSIGTYHYTAVDGAIKTIPSYTIHAPLTKEEFADALANGFRLVKYRKVTTKARPAKTGRSQRRATTKIIATPIP